MKGRRGSAGTGGRRGAGGTFVERKWEKLIFIVFRDWGFATSYGGQARWYRGIGGVSPFIV